MKEIRYAPLSPKNNFPKKPWIDPDKIKTLSLIGGAGAIPKFLSGAQ